VCTYPVTEVKEALAQILQQRLVLGKK